MSKLTLTKAQWRVIESLFRRGSIKKTINTWEGFQFKVIMPLIKTGLVEEHPYRDGSSYRSGLPSRALYLTDAGQQLARERFGKDSDE